MCKKKPFTMFIFVLIQLMFFSDLNVLIYNFQNKSEINNLSKRYTEKNNFKKVMLNLLTNVYICDGFYDKKIDTFEEIISEHVVFINNFGNFLRKNTGYEKIAKKIENILTETDFLKIFEKDIIKDTNNRKKVFFDKFIDVCIEKYDSNKTTLEKIVIFM